MKLGINLADYGELLPDTINAVGRAESMGYDSVWVGEAYGADAVSALGFLAASTTRMRIGSAVMQIHARTPAMTAMTVMTLDHLSRGRMQLGLGLSGPQVVEGWHGSSFAHPVQTVREYVEIIRMVVARRHTVAYEGERYVLPYNGDDASGLAKSLRSRIVPVRERIPILLASLGARSVELTGEIADGWLPIFYSPTQEEVLCEALDKGLARRPADLGELEIIACPQIAIGTDLEECRDRLRPMLALYVGAMGARGRNFYFDLVTRLGYGDAARRIQDAYLDGRKADAIAEVPDALIDEVCLVGSPARVADQLAAWKASRVSTISVRSTDVTTLEALAGAL